MPDPCSRCRLPLPTGAEHPTSDACVRALRAALDEAQRCASCGKVPQVQLCPPCAATAFGKGVAAKAAQGAAAHAMDWFMKGGLGDGLSRDTDQGGKKFVP